MTTQTNPVNIRGVDYPSQKAAAEALGVTESAVCSALAKGRADTIGIGSRRVPVPIDGVTYPTMRAASAALGISYMAVRWLASRSGAAQ